MIYISAGHFKQRPGACYDGVCEHDLTVQWADRIHFYLGDKGVRVPEGTLRTKTNFINKNNPNLAVEVHFNSAVNAEGVRVGEGSETLYFPSSPKGKQAAEMLQDRLGMVFPPDRGAKQGWYQMNPKKGADFFLEKTRCVSLIVEPEFIHHLDIIRDNMDLACNVIAGTLLKIEEELFDG